MGQRVLAREVWQMDHSANIALRMVEITKTFPGVLANDRVDFDVKIGEVHGLLGENGAGKTTLMNILYGLYQPDSGEILLHGDEVDISSPQEANDFGIGMVHQHFMLVEKLTALQNIVLGLPSERPPLLDLGPARARFKEMVNEYGLDLDPSTPVWQLPMGDRQWLEILKLLFRDARILVLDEPTSVLSPSQAELLFKSIRRLADKGCSIIFISHKLEEMKQIADRITVLRDGQVVGTVDPKKATPSELAQMMVGREVILNRRPRPPSESKQAVLTVTDLSCEDDRGIPALLDLSLNMYAGEIVGVAGVDGNGQKELAECIAGLRQPTKGTIQIDGKPISGVVRDPSLLGFIPEDRTRTGLVLGFGVAENLILKTFTESPFVRHGIMQGGAIRREANALIQEYDIMTPHPMMPVQFLSGGNQQKVLVARELSGQPALVVASHATRGLDVGAIEGVHKALLKERNRGAAVLFISAELSEVLALSDRIIVLFEGQIMGELDGESADVDLIGELMMGHRESAGIVAGSAISKSRKEP